MTRLVRRGMAKERVEQALRDEHLRVALQDYTVRAIPTLDIDAYAEKVHRANPAITS